MLCCKLISFLMSLLMISCTNFFGICAGEVVGYGGYSRERLVSDGMQAVCTPAVSGDFIQPWYCADWSAERWEQHMEMLTGAGIDMLIVQNCASSYEGDDEALAGRYAEYYYPSAMAENPDISVPDCMVYADMLENCLKAAKKHGVKIWIGLGGNIGWWDCKFTDSGWRDAETDFINCQADEIYALYHGEYAETIGGWYWYHEMYVARNERYEKYWCGMINSCLEHLNALDRSMPILFSPFISSHENAGVMRTVQCWSYFMQNTSLRDGDIFCPQDGFGTVKTMSLAEIERIAFAIRFACSLYPNVRLWFNVECFTESWGSAPVARFVNQINICSKFAEKLITFSFSHYYNPMNGQKEFYDAYLKYLGSVVTV